MKNESESIGGEVIGVFLEGFDFFLNRLFVRLQEAFYASPFTFFPVGIFGAFVFAKSDASGQVAEGIRRVIALYVRERAFPEKLKTRVLTQHQAAVFFYTFIIENTIQYALNPDSQLTVGYQLYDRIKQMKLFALLRKLKIAEYLIARLAGMVLTMWISLMKWTLVLWGVVLLIRLQEQVENAAIGAPSLLPSLSQSNPIVKDEELGRRRQR